VTSQAEVDHIHEVKVKKNLNLPGEVWDITWIFLQALQSLMQRYSLQNLLTSLRDDEAASFYEGNHTNQQNRDFA